jgi:hypothetical protein
MIFEERTGAEGTVSLVSRDASLQDDAVLPAAFFKTAGDKMYAGLMANFTGDLFFTQPPPPLPAGASDDEVIASLTILYKKIIELGYALDVTVSEERLDMEAYAKELTLAKSFARSYAAAAPVPSLSSALSATAGRSVTYRLRGPKFPCFTVTKVQILTRALLPKLPQHCLLSQYLYSCTSTASRQSTQHSTLVCIRVPQWGRQWLGYRYSVYLLYCYKSTNTDASGWKRSACNTVGQAVAGVPGLPTHRPRRDAGSGVSPAMRQSCYCAFRRRCQLFLSALCVDMSFNVCGLFGGSRWLQQQFPW